MYATEHQIGLLDVYPLTFYFTSWYS